MTNKDEMESLLLSKSIPYEKYTYMDLLLIAKGVAGDQTFNNLIKKHFIVYKDMYSRRA